jgi:hypothetical protein
MSPHGPQFKNQYMFTVTGRDRPRHDRPGFDLGLGLTLTLTRSCRGRSRLGRLRCDTMFTPRPDDQYKGNTCTECISETSY